MKQGQKRKLTLISINNLNSYTNFDSKLNNKKTSLDQTQCLKLVKNKIRNEKLSNFDIKFQNVKQYENKFPPLRIIDCLFIKQKFKMK